MEQACDLPPYTSISIIYQGCNIGKFEVTYTGVSPVPCLHLASFIFGVSFITYRHCLGQGIVIKAIADSCLGRSDCICLILIIEKIWGKLLCSNCVMCLYPLIWAFSHLEALWIFPSPHQHPCPHIPINVE